MKTFTFTQLKRMDRQELKSAKFLVKQDMDPKYCSEPERIQYLKKIYSYIKFLMYNPSSQEA